MGQTVMLLAAGAAVLLAALLGAAFLLIGARVAGIANVTFLKAAGAALACALVSLAASIAAERAGVVSLAGFTLGVLLSLWIVKAVFATDWRRAAIAWAFNVLAQLAAAFLIFLASSLTF